MLKTDASKALVPLDEIVSGGPPPDGIPAIDRPVFVASADSDAWLKPKEPVLVLEVNTTAASLSGRRQDSRSASECDAWIVAYRRARLVNIAGTVNDVLRSVTDP